MTSYHMPECLRCKHFHYSNKDANACDAFPDEIPNEIFYERHSHREPYPNADNPQDNGIQFEPIEEVEEQ